MASAREHVEEIRRTKFSIGGEPNPLTEDLHQAVKNLSAELYAKDVHCLMELIQNAEDNEYLEGVDPSLELIITSEDITATGAPATLLIFNNEKGFSAKNVESICSVGRSTKKGNKKRRYIGEKGIGFKSVFLVTAHPYIFSNGYQIRFSEEPCPHCNLGYIVPEWVEENPTLSDIQQIYGSGTTLPTTITVLPLKSDKVKPLKQQLSCIHPEVLLFLSKIKRLSVREHDKDPRLNTVSAIAITSETNCMTRKNIDAQSYMLHLAAEEKSNWSEKECSYYMWKQNFPVGQENKVEKRMEVEDWVITLAFPYGERLNRGMSSPGVYAFLPTEMVTNFPFIIEADFLLASSRETILLDNKWNQGILDCVPHAFINAFITLVKMTEDASLPDMFKFIPVNSSSYEKLNAVRESIRAKLVEEDIVPRESYTQQKFFHKPREVGRLMPTFWNILAKARNEGVNLLNLSSHGRYILCSSFDKEEYKHILDFLGVEPVNNKWYSKCIQGCSLVVAGSEDLYLDLLLFISDNWTAKLDSTNIKNIPLVKYVDFHGNVSFCSIKESAQSGKRVVSVSRESCHVSWLIDCNREFRCVANYFFMPKSTHEAISSFFRKETVLEFLVNYVKVCSLDVSTYAALLTKFLNSDRKLAIAFVHFLYHSLWKTFLSKGEIDYLCGIMPLVDNYGHITTQRKAVIVPANGSKWASLIGSNPWRGESYVELAEDYLNPGYFAGEFICEEQLLDFLKARVAASDIPYISPPNAAISTVSSPLSKQNAFLLLDWIHQLKQSGSPIPERFLTCIQDGCWLRVIMNGSTGYMPPSQSFMLPSSWGSILQDGSVLVDIPLIDQSFYGDEINRYKGVLKTIGVRRKCGEACQFIGNHLMSLVASPTLNRGYALSILNFTRFLNTRLLALNKFINSIKYRRWLRTSCGDKFPVESVLFQEEWRTASQISDIPFIDQAYYGEEILSFKKELQLLGVVIDFSRSYQLVVDNLKSPSHVTFLKADAVLWILECMRHLRSSDKLVTLLKGIKCFKTNDGYKFPRECFLFDPQWGCILQVFNDYPYLPLIDRDSYKNIFSYKNELKQTGVKVDFEEAVKEFAEVFRLRASSMTKENVFSFLSCFRKLKDKFPADLKKCIREEKWLRTRLGDNRPPRGCILFGTAWESIAPYTALPFINDSDNCYGKDIHKYKKELKSMGVVVYLKEGLKFVVDCFYIPTDPSYITPTNVLSLLEGIRILLQDKNYSFPDAFTKKVSQKWLKTGHDGYRPPDECLLFDSKWGAYLKRTDGPFIDEGFYGSNIASYRKELNAIGVIVDVEKGCQLIASHLDFHLKFSTIVRVYNYLSLYKWEPDNDADRRIWIPDGSENGEWVSPGECVLHDKDGLFSLQLRVLEKYYVEDDKKILLNFFSRAFNVKCNPSVDDYCKLWKVWESSGRQLSHAECCKFWGYMLKHWNAKTEKTLLE